MNNGTLSQVKSKNSLCVIRTHGPEEPKEVMLEEALAAEMLSEADFWGLLFHRFKDQVYVLITGLANS